MVTQITINQAVQLYLQQLQSEASKLPYVQQNIKRFMVTDPKTNRMFSLSYLDLIREVQNMSQIGQNKAVEYVQNLKDVKGEAMYQVVG